MNIFRTIITTLYPFQMKLSRLTGMGIRILENKENLSPQESFYSLKAMSGSREEIDFNQFRNKKILVVNLASKCGFTPQYAELEKLNQLNKNLVILGFPSNNFGKQEPGNDVEINDFCKKNYGVTFLLFKKDEVKGKLKQPVYQWLTDKNKNGWNGEEPQWNFYKYLIDEEGNLAKVFSSSVSPLDIKNL